MSAIFRRAAALCLCVMLLAASAAADTSGMKAYSYTLHFTMHPEAYPAADQPIIQGIADMLNITGISGVYTTDGHAFDNNMTLQLGSRPETATSIRVYGKPAHWWVESSLLGGAMLMVNNAALLEFGMKAYAHLNMPLQYPLLLINPYVHTSAFEWIMPEWEAVFGGSGSRTVSIDDLYSLASFIADNGESDRLIRDDTSLHMRVSLASEKWLKEAGEMLEAFLNALKGTPEGDALFAVQIACKIQKIGFHSSMVSAHGGTVANIRHRQINRSVYISPASIHTERKHHKSLRKGEVCGGKSQRSA